MNTLNGLLEDSEVNRKRTEDLNRVREMFMGKNPTVRVADMVGELAGWAA